MNRRLLVVLVAGVGSFPVFGQDAVFDSYLTSADRALSKNDFAGAEKFLKLAEKEAEGDVSKLIKLWGKQAGVAERQFKYAEAEKCYKKTLAHAEETNKGTKENRLWLAHVLTITANHYRLRGMNDDAAPLYKKALAIREKVNGPKSWETAQLLRDIADNRRDAGELDAAEAIYRKAISIVNGMQGFEYHLAFCLANLGELHLRQDKLDEAEALCRQALDTYDKAKGKFPFNLALCYGTLGETLRRQKKGAEALAAFQESIKYLGDGVYMARVFPIIRNAAKCLREQGKEADAKKLEDKLKEFEEKHKKANAAAAKETP